MPDDVKDHKIETRILTEIRKFLRFPLSSDHFPKFSPLRKKSPNALDKFTTLNEQERDTDEENTLINKLTNNHKQININELQFESVLRDVKKYGPSNIVTTPAGEEELAAIAPQR